MNYQMNGSFIMPRQISARKTAEKKNFTISLDRISHDYLEQTTGKSKNEIINEAVKDWIERDKAKATLSEKYDARTRESIADIKAGRVMSTSRLFESLKQNPKQKRPS
jgi:hypothetical protein